MRSSSPARSSALRVYGCVVGMRDGGDQQVHYPAAWLAPSLHGSGGQLRIAAGDRIVNGQRVKAALDGTETVQPECAILGVFRDKHAKLQLSKNGDADGRSPGMGATSLAIRTLVSRMPRLAGSPTDRQGCHQEGHDRLSNPDQPGHRRPRQDRPRAAKCAG